MTHTLGIRVEKSKRNAGVATCRNVTVREKLLRKLLGSPVKLTVIVPGDSVDSVEITESPVQKGVSYGLE